MPPSTVLGAVQDKLEITTNCLCAKQKSQQEAYLSFTGREPSTEQQEAWCPGQRSTLGPEQF